MVKYSISNNGMSIPNSYLVKKKSEMKNVIKQIREENKDNGFDILKRSDMSFVREWRSHNIFYNLHIMRSHTRTVDFEYPQAWYFKVAYALVGLF